MGHVPRSWLGCSVPSHSFNARHLFPKTYTKSGLGGILQTQRQETRNSLISWLPSPIRTPREDSSWSKSEVRSLSRSKNSTRTTSAMLAPREALAKTRTVKSVDFAPTKAWIIKQVNVPSNFKEFRSLHNKTIFAEEAMILAGAWQAVCCTTITMSKSDSSRSLNILIVWNSPEAWRFIWHESHWIEIKPNPSLPPYVSRHIQTTCWSIGQYHSATASVQTSKSWDVQIVGAMLSKAPFCRSTHLKSEKLHQGFLNFFFG